MPCVHSRSWGPRVHRAQLVTRRQGIMMSLQKLLLVLSLETAFAQFDLDCYSLFGGEGQEVLKCRCVVQNNCFRCQMLDASLERPLGCSSSCDNSYCGDPYARRRRSYTRRRRSYTPRRKIDFTANLSVPNGLSGPLIAEGNHSVAMQKNTTKTQNMVETHTEHAGTSPPVVFP